MNKLLLEAIACQASDLHITVGIPPVLRIDGQLTFTGHNSLTLQDTAALLDTITTAGQRENFRQTGELDFSYAASGLGRFRISAFRHQGNTAIAVRIIPDKIPTLEQLGLPAAVKTLALKARGLVLVTGPAGSGKSTTLAAMIQLINLTRSCHIITLEDPVEYRHQHAKSIIHQREVYNDTRSYATALRAALREDPDVILVGEMRDMETIATAITAAETGHLVLATLHTGDTAQAIERITDAFLPQQHQQIRSQLSQTLQGIVAQQLLPRRDGHGRIAAAEILLVTPAVRNLIREGKTHQLLSVIQTGGKLGMQTMDFALRELLRQEAVTYENALAGSLDQETFIRLGSSS